MRVAERTGVPVIPVGIRGTATVNPPGRRLLRPGRVDIVIGRPVTTDARIREATDQLMQRIVILAGQQYVDEYV